MDNSSLVRVGGATLNQTPLAWSQNLKNITDAIKEAQSQKIEILCLPELCISGYTSEDLFLGKWFTDKQFVQLEEIVKHCTDIVVALGISAWYNETLYDCAVVIRNNEVLGFSVKQFLALDGVHYEPRWFTPWKAGKIVNFEWNGKNYPFGDVIYHHEDAVIGFEICEDAWKGVNRPGYRLANRGVNLFLNPSASHFAFGKTHLREALVTEGTGDFGGVYIFANLLGNQSGRVIFDGEIYIGKEGKLLQRNTRLGFKQVEVISADVSFNNKTQQPVQLNFDPSDKNTEFIKATSLGLFDYLRKSRTRGFVLSLSGGADSSTCAVLVAEMIKRACNELGVEAFLTAIHRKDIRELEGIKGLKGKEKLRFITSQLLYCAYQGTENSSFHTFQSAEELAKDIGATFYHWKIDEEVASYTQKIETAINRDLTWEQDDITLQNIQARSRSPIIWMLANLKNALLLTTSNRSEGDVGYTTMDGDTSGSLAPIAAVDKVFVREWLVWAENNLGYKGLQYVNALQPSAELRPGDEEQTDEKDLMPFSIMLKIERLAIKEHRSPIEVFHQLSKEVPKVELKIYLEKFFKLWSRNQWKRERIAPSFHLDDFNIDPKTWCRFPILSGGFSEELEIIRGL